MKTWEERRDEDREWRKHFGMASGCGIGSCLIYIYGLFYIMKATGMERNLWMLAGVWVALAIGGTCGFYYSKLLRDKVTEWRFLRAGRRK
jgi:hypothetical protein